MVHPASKIRPSRALTARITPVIALFWSLLGCVGASLTIAAGATSDPGSFAGGDFGSGAPSPGGSASSKPVGCATCHAFTPAFSHPVDITPRLAVPSHLPLSGGLITCTTCHVEADHGTGPARLTPASGRSTTGMLRPTLGAESFCAQCHTGSSGGKESHASGLTKAHPARASGVPGATAGPAILDSESRACMACHDGASASDAGLHSLGARRDGGFGRTQEHPIGVRYQDNREREIRLVTPASLDKRVRLFDQTVGCGSCHSVFSKQKQLLVMDNLGSRLCLSCHVE